MFTPGKPLYAAASDKRRLPQRAGWLTAGLVLLGLAGFAREPAPSGEASIGATIPWTTYEAENAVTNGELLGPDLTGATAMREASGRRCVRLGKAGQYLEFKSLNPAQGLVLRYSLPDSPDGKGIDATLSLSINGGAPRKLALTSRLSHLYGDYPFKNDPAAGSHRNFWDEVRVMPGEIQPGDVIRLEKRQGDDAEQYLIDLIDLEPVPKPLARPDGFLSITDFGSVSEAAGDSRAALLSAIKAAKAQKKGVWIPAGKFVIKGQVDLSDITVQGAGMWHTTLVGTADYAPADRVTLSGNGANVTLSDLSIVGHLNYRNDSEPNDGIGGSFGAGSVLRNLWVEHTKAGAWLVNADGLLVEGCRFRNTIADGINLCVGMRNTVVRNCSARGTGDDCFAMWPATYATSSYPHGGNRYVACTAQLPFLAQAFAIYGGDGNLVERCDATDIPYGAGLYASTTFPTEFGFRGTTLFRQVRLTRAGAHDGALGTVANRVSLPGVRFEDIDVIDSPADSVKFTSLNGGTLHDAVLDRIRITRPGGRAVVAAAGAKGSARISNVAVSPAPAEHRPADAPEFELIRGEGTQRLESPP